MISVLSNVAPKETHDICELFFKGDIEGSRNLQLKALPLIDALFCEVNPIPVKAAMKMIGYDCGNCRLPLTNLASENALRLQKFFA